MQIPHVVMVHQREGVESALAAPDREVLQLIANGESYDEAAALLKIDRDRIEAAMARVRAHLGALTDEHAVAISFRCRLID